MKLCESAKDKRAESQLMEKVAGARGLQEIGKLRRREREWKAKGKEISKVMKEELVDQEVKKVMCLM